MSSRSLGIALGILCSVAVTGGLLWLGNQLVGFVLPGEFGRVPRTTSTEPVDIDWREAKSGARLHLRIPRTYFSHISKPIPTDKSNFERRGIEHSGVPSFTLRLTLADLERPISQANSKRAFTEAPMSVTMYADRACALNVSVEHARADVLEEVRKGRMYLAGAANGFEVYRTMWCGTDADRLPPEARSRPGLPDGCGDVLLEERRVSSKGSRHPAYLTCSPGPSPGEACMAFDEFGGWNLQFLVRKPDVARYEEIRALVVGFMGAYVVADSVSAARSCGAESPVMRGARRIHAGLAASAFR
jgi:hypothetical protein